MTATDLIEAARAAGPLWGVVALAIAAPIIHRRNQRTERAHRRDVWRQIRAIGRRHG